MSDCNFKIKVDFWLSADELDLKEATNIIGINPTNTRLKESFKIKEYAKILWEYSTDYQYSYVIEFQLLQIKDILNNKCTQIREYCDINNIEAGFDIIVRTRNYILPELIIPIEFTKFAAKLNARIAFDIYVNLEEEF